MMPVLRGILAQFVAGELALRPGLIEGMLQQVIAGDAGIERGEKVRHGNS